MDVDFETRAGVAWLTLNRPSVYNALNRECLDAIAEFSSKVDRDDGIRVGVVSGRGKYFCAGADIPEFLASVTQPMSASDEGMAFLDAVFSTFAALRSVRKPLLACVNGPAVGGGLELVLSCDLVISAESASFGDGHSNYGIIPGGGGSVLLARSVPLNVAKYLLLTGEMLSAREMCSHGLVNMIVPDSDLVQRTQQFARSLALKSPLVLAHMKRLANEALSRDLEDAICDEIRSLREHTRSEDLTEGLRAFVERRPPTFKGT